MLKVLSDAGFYLSLSAIPTVAIPYSQTATSEKLLPRNTLRISSPYFRRTEIRLLLPFQRQLLQQAVVVWVDFLVVVCLVKHLQLLQLLQHQIGRASCRER